MSDPHILNESVPIKRLSAAIESGRAGYMLPILEAVRDFGCGWATIPQRAGRFEIPTGRPTIGIVGDDSLEALGLAAFHRKSLRRFVGTCAGGVLVSCAPELRLYAAAAVVAAERRRNAVLIETRPEREAEWLEFLNEANPTMRLVVGTVRPAGGVH